MQVLIASSITVKNRYVATVAEANTLMVTIANKDDWNFLHPASRLSEAVKQLSMKTKNRFWDDWTLMDPSKLRKGYSEVEMVNELDAGLPSIEQAVNAVATESCALKASYHARVAAIKTAKASSAAKSSGGVKKAKKGKAAAEVQ